MEKAHLKAILITKQPQRMRRYRQFYAFRDRIIQRFKNQEFELAYYKNSTRVFCELYMIATEAMDHD